MKNLLKLTIVVFTLLSCTNAQAGLFDFKNAAVGAGLGAGAAFIAAGGAKGIAYKRCHLADGSLNPDPKEGCYETDYQPPEEVVDLDAIEDPDDPVLLRSSHTAKLRKGLNAERASAGLPPDPNNCDGHHIVPKTEGRGWAKGFANDARDILQSCNIDIDYVGNGVYLPSKDDGSSDCEGSYHKTIHGKKYYKDVADRLKESHQNGCDSVLDELQAIKNDLIQGVY